MSFMRKNLAYVVRYTENKSEALVNILSKVSGTAIVYVRSRQRTADLARELQQAGFSAHFFHAGLNRDEKTLRQDAWKRGECRVIVATNAFGMGIDKADVRLVIHIDMPGSLEEYFQEAGRAGRDGEKSYAIALCSSTETSKLQKHVTDEFPNRQLITRIYDALGNYYAIAVGFGAFVSHGFPIQDFCRKLHFSETQVLSAIKILELSGYIEYIEEPEAASRLMFLANREELYRTPLNTLTDSIIQVILRSYTGPFANYVYIDESLIATRTNSTREAVYNELVALSKMHIISYIPQKKLPQIVFSRAREEPSRVAIPYNAFEERRQRSEERINKVKEYITEQNICRSRLLLDYFGEHNDHDCRICDVCLRKTQSGIRNWEFNEVRTALTAILKEKKQETASNLSYSLPLDKEKNITAMRYIIDNDKHFTLANGMLFYTE
jgi:ATP-dependent DNA helicase RecQ